MGGVGDSERAKKTVFVTVGTTSFDTLVKAVDSEKVKAELFRKGYTNLLIQMGRGSYFPSKFPGDDGSLAVDYFKFSPSIAEYLTSASLVISHAGTWSMLDEPKENHIGSLTLIILLHSFLLRSGSIFETLRIGKPLIVVVNEDLMDNHQSELAEELAERKHLYCARPHTLHETIEIMQVDSLLPYPPGDAMPAVKLINMFLGFPFD